MGEWVMYMPKTMEQANLSSYVSPAGIGFSIHLPSFWADYFRLRSTVNDSPRTRKTNQPGVLILTFFSLCLPDLPAVAEFLKK